MVVKTHISSPQFAFHMFNCPNKIKRTFKYLLFLFLFLLFLVINNYLLTIRSHYIFQYYIVFNNYLEIMQIFKYSEIRLNLINKKKNVLVYY